MTNSTEKWNDELFERMSPIGDPLGQQAIHAVFARGKLEEVNRMLTLLRNNDDLPPGLPPEVQAFLQQSAQLPPWTDQAKLDAGARAFMDHGLLTALGLWCASLPECYALGPEARILALTGRLIKEPNRRIHETARMVYPVMAPGGLGPNGLGVRQAQKVRLIHAAIRHFLLHPQPAGLDATTRGSLQEVMISTPWDVGKDGMPLNQVEQAFTLLTFSHVILRTLEQLGIRLTTEQKDAYVHCWNVVAHVMGVRDEMLPDDAEDAVALFDAIKRWFGGRPDSETSSDAAAGRQLMDSLLGVLEGLIPWRPLKPLPGMISIRFVGPETSEILGIRGRYGFYGRVLFALVAKIWWFLEDLARKIFRDVPFSRKVSIILSQQILFFLMRATADGPPRPLQIPDELQKAWGLELPPDLAPPQPTQ